MGSQAIATLCISPAVVVTPPEAMVDTDSTSTLTFGQGVYAATRTRQRFPANSKSPAPTSPKPC